MQKPYLNDLVSVRNKFSEKLSDYKRSLKIFKKHNCDCSYLKKDIKTLEEKISELNKKISIDYFPLAKELNNIYDISKIDGLHKDESRGIEIYSKKTGNFKIVRLKVAQQKGVECAFNAFHYSGLLRRCISLQELLKDLKNEMVRKACIESLVKSFKEQGFNFINGGIGAGACSDFFSTKHGHGEFDNKLLFKVNTHISGVNKENFDKYFNNQCRKVSEKFLKDNKPVVILVGAPGHNMTMRLEYDFIEKIYYAFLIDSCNFKLDPDHSEYTKSVIKIVTGITNGAAKIK